MANHRLTSKKLIYKYNIILIDVIIQKIFIFSNRNSQYLKA